jgi:hypothetical protein
VLAHRLPLDLTQINDARLGRLLDALDGVSATIWPQLVAHALALGSADLGSADLGSADLGSADLAAVYYDITCFYFEGEYEEAPEITCGSSRDGKADTKQVEAGRGGAHRDRHGRGATGLSRAGGQHGGRAHAGGQPAPLATGGDPSRS